MKCGLVVFIKKSSLKRCKIDFFFVLILYCTNFIIDSKIYVIVSLHHILVHTICSTTIIIKTFRQSLISNKLSIHIILTCVELSKDIILRRFSLWSKFLTIEEIKKKAIFTKLSFIFSNDYSMSYIITRVIIGVLLIS